MAKGLNRLNLCVTIPDRIVDFWTRPRPLATHQSGPLAATCCTGAVLRTYSTHVDGVSSPRFRWCVCVLACKWLLPGAAEAAANSRQNRIVDATRPHVHTSTPLLFLWAPRRLDAPRPGPDSHRLLRPLRSWLAGRPILRHPRCRVRLSAIPCPKQAMMTLCR